MWIPKGAALIWDSVLIRGNTVCDKKNYKWELKILLIFYFFKLSLLFYVLRLYSKVKEIPTERSFGWNMGSSWQRVLFVIHVFSCKLWHSRGCLSKFIWYLVILLQEHNVNRNMICFERWSQNYFLPVNLNFWVRSNINHLKSSMYLTSPRLIVPGFPSKHE